MWLGVWRLKQKGCERFPGRLVKETWLHWEEIPSSFLLLLSGMWPWWWQLQSHVRLWKVSVTQSCPTLCNPMDCSLPGSSVHGILRGKNTGVDCHVPLQGIFPTQISNLGLLHCRQILYCLSHQGSPGLCGNLKLYVEIIHQNERKEGYRKPGCQMNTKLPYQSWTTYPWTSLM